MAVLKAAARNALPASKFALPGVRKFPINDRAHATNAKATQGVARGTLSAAAAARIRTKANAMLKGK